jgi:signal recognition particle subunit SRP54
MADKLRTATFTLEDFLSQFQQLRKMGPMQQLVAMLPGAGSLLNDAQISDEDLGRVEAIIQSMTQEERRSPKIIGGSRKRRIAAGAGVKTQDVNALLRQYGETQKMMKMLAEGKGIPGIPGLPPQSFGRRRKR